MGSTVPSTDKENGGMKRLISSYISYVILLGPGKTFSMMSFRIQQVNIEQKVKTESHNYDHYNKKS